MFVVCENVWAIRNDSNERKFRNHRESRHYIGCLEILLLAEENFFTKACHSTTIARLPKMHSMHNVLRYQ